MTQNNSLDVTSSKSLAHIQSSLQVGMEDVVNVFISRLEDDLHAKRERLQTSIRNLKTKIEELTDEQKNRSCEVNLVSINNPFVSITQRCDDIISVLWDTSLVSINVVTTVRSLKYQKHTAYYNKECTSGEVEVQLTISPDAVLEYKQLNNEISELTAELVKVNTDLREMSRKERKVRGIIAEMKLKDMGMEDLLNEPQLLAIVNNS